jgi:osmotically-inducible protein OsmY
VLAETKHLNPICPTSVERLAKSRLAETGYPRLKTVECSFQNGTMTLRGRVPSYYQKQLAQEALRKVTHVRQLINHIEVLSLR